LQHKLNTKWTDIKNIEEEIQERWTCYPRKVSTEETSLEEERQEYTFGRPITTRVTNWSIIGYYIYTMGVSTQNFCREVTRYLSAFLIRIFPLAFLLTYTCIRNDHKNVFCICICSLRPHVLRTIVAYKNNNIVHPHVFALASLFAYKIHKNMWADEGPRFSEKTKKK
jgi:hypothetical protein